MATATATRKAPAKKVPAARKTTARKVVAATVPTTSRVNKRAVAAVKRDATAANNTRKAAGTRAKTSATVTRVTESPITTRPLTLEPTVEERLAALIPDKSKSIREDGGDYYTRLIHGVRDIDVFETTRQLKRNLLMYGDTGAGKSMAVEAYAAYYELPLVVINCNGGIDPNTFFGMLVQDPDTRVIRWVDSDVTIAMENGPAIIFFDEVNFAQPRVMATFHSAMRQRFFTILERNNEKRMVHDESWFVAAYNPDYAGTRDLNKAFRNRLAVKVPWGYDPVIEAKLVNSTVMLELANNIRTRSKEGKDFTTPVSTNMLIEFEELAVSLNTTFAVENFIAAFDEGDEQESIRRTINEAFITKIERQMGDLKKQIDSITGGN